MDAKHNVKILAATTRGLVGALLCACVVSLLGIVPLSAAEPAAPLPWDLTPSEIARSLKTAITVEPARDGVPEKLGHCSGRGSSRSRRH